jgi:hypothetical protein
VVRDDPKLLDDGRDVLQMNGVVGVSIHGYENVSMLDGILTNWSSASCVPQNKNKKVEKIQQSQS